MNPAVYGNVKGFRYAADRFIYEQDTEGVSRIGMLKRIQQRGSEFRAIFGFKEELPPINPNAIAAHNWDLHLADFEFCSTHCAVKNGDLLTILCEHDLIPTTKQKDGSASS